MSTKLLSVCIPVYNFDVKELVSALREEINAGNLPAEIILIDDASSPEFLGLNKNLVDIYVALPKNIGRSKIRNLFLEYAQGAYLLFLDCDSKIISTKFLTSYLNFINKNSGVNVIYGGFLEDPRQKSLRSIYSRKREIQTSEVRKKSPYHTFKGINFVIRYDILSKFPFNERISGYGYEDFLFAKQLQKQIIKIKHISNPVLHFDESSNEEFLLKIEASAETLATFLKKNPAAKDLSDTKIVKTLSLLNTTKTKGLFKISFNLFKNQIRNHLLSGTSQMLWIDVYRLGILLHKL